MVTASGAIIVLACLVFFMAQTHWGKRQIASLVASGLSKPGTSVFIGKLEGLIPFEVKLDRLSVSDGEGQWLIIEGFHLHWLLSSLFHGRLHVVELSADAVRLDRLPSRSPEKRERRIEIPAWPAKLISLEVERLAVDRVVTGKMVLGEPGVFHIEGYQVVHSDPAVGLSSFLKIQRMDKPNTQALIEASLGGEIPFLSLRFELEEGEGGVLASALGLSGKGPLVILVSGEAPISYWRGQIASRVGDLDLLQAEIILDTQQDTSLTLQGFLNTSPRILCPALMPLFGEETHFTMTVQAADRRRLSLEDLGLDTGRLAVHCAGLFDMEGQTGEGDYTIRLEDISILQHMVKGHMAGEFTAGGHFSGDLMRPQANLSFTLLHARLAEIQAGQISGDLQLALLEPGARGRPVLRVSGNGLAEGLSLEDGQPFLEAHFDWSVSLEEEGPRLIQIRQFQLGGENITLSLSGNLNPFNLSGQLNSTLQVRELNGLSRMFGIALSGATGLRASIEKMGRADPFTAHVEGWLRDLGSESARLKGLLGGKIVYGGDVELTASRLLTVSEIRMVASWVSLTGGFSFGQPDGRLSGHWSFSVPELGVLSDVLRHDMGGSLTLEGKIQGSLPALRVTAMAMANDLHMGDLEFKKLGATLQADREMSRLWGEIQLSLVQMDHPLDLSTNFLLQRHDLTLTDVLLRGVGIEGKGHLGVDLAEKRVAGKFQGSSKDLDVFSPLLGEHVQGSAELKVQFSPSEEGQCVDLTLDAHDLALPFGQARECRLRSALVSAFNEPRGNIHLQVKDFGRGDLRFESLGLTCEGGLQDLGFNARIQGRQPRELEMTTQGVFKGKKTIELKRLEGNYGAYPVVLARPAVIAFLESGLTIDQLALKVASGNLNVSGQLDDETLSISADFEELPLTAVGMWGEKALMGSLSGRVLMEGKPDKPQAHIEIVAKELRYLAPFLERLPPATAYIEAWVKEDRFVSTITLEKVLEDPAIARLDIPLRLSIVPFLLWSPDQETIQGQIQAEADLARIAERLSVDDQRLEGRLIVDGTITGNVGNPEVKAHCRLEGGRYENPYTGTVLRDIYVQLSTDKRRLIVDSARAKDAHDGVIRMRGWLDLAPDEDFPFEVEVTLEKTKLLGGYDVSAPVNGTLKVSGSLSDGQLNGEFTVGPSEIQIPLNLDSDGEEPEGGALDPNQGEDLK
jgi:translocation and assembly module TamB